VLGCFGAKDRKSLSHYSEGSFQEKKFGQWGSPSQSHFKRKSSAKGEQRFLLPEGFSKSG
jgi:hypothetical protein